MNTIDKDALIGAMEAAYDSDLQASALKGQAKVITDLKKEGLETFARDCDVDKSIISKAYTRYKELRNKTADADDEDYYTVIAMVDEAFQEEEE